MLPLGLRQPPLLPDPDRARSAFRRELADPAYAQGDPVERLLEWLDRLLGRGLQAAADSSWLARLLLMLVLAGIAVGVLLLLSRARRTARAPREPAPVLTGARVTAAGLRDRAEAALDEGRYGEALVDGFRALATRQAEAGALADRPGTTAHEVSLALTAAHPGHAERIRAAALLFDLVLYGDRPGTADQARSTLDLDLELAGALR